MGRNAWLDQQLAPATIDDSACGALIADRFPHLAWSTRRRPGTTSTAAGASCSTSGTRRIARAAWSKRQLFEVMVDFWSNHLNVTNPCDGVWWSPPRLRPRVIRSTPSASSRTCWSPRAHAPGDDEATSTTPSRPRTTRTRTTGASCWSSIPWASTPATPRRTMRTRRCS